MENQAEPLPQPIRETFFQQFMDNAGVFARDNLVLIPELQGLAIIPTWTIPQEHLPAGIIQGRDGKLQGPAETIHMAQQLLLALKHTIKVADAAVVSIDSIMGQMAEDIRGKQQQLQQLQRDIEAAARQRAGADGAAPSPPGSA